MNVPSTSIIRNAMEYRKRQDALDPVRWFILMAPDGSQMGDICEMHVSEAARRNESRMALYLASEQHRNDARKEWLEKREEDARLSTILQHAQAAIEEQARTAEVPLPETASKITRKLVASRKENPIPSKISYFASEAEPVVSYTAADYLWTRALDARGKVIRVEGTRRGRHD